MSETHKGRDARDVFQSASENVFLFIFFPISPVFKKA